MNNYKIIAVIVAYNNSKELDRILNAINKQVYKVDEIIIIDNSEESYKKYNKIVIRNINNKSKINYYSALRNIGSAGGFAKGMEIALKFKCDFIWLNDQDGYPSNNCLNELIKTYNSKDNDMIIYAPIILSDTDKSILWNFRSRINIFNNSYQVKEKQIEFNIDVAGTTGTLIPINVINSIGIYNDKKFFVGNEDIEYCLRAKRKNIKIICTKNARYYHPDIVYRRDNQNNFTSKFPRVKKYLPLFIGGIEQNGNTISRYNCLGSVYINNMYSNWMVKYINVIYSIVRIIIQKNKFRVRETICIYMKKKYDIHNVKGINNFNQL